MREGEGLKKEDDYDDNDDEEEEKEEEEEINAQLLNMCIKD